MRARRRFFLAQMKLPSVIGGRADRILSEMCIASVCMLHNPGLALAPSSSIVVSKVWVAARHARQNDFRTFLVSDIVVFGPVNSTPRFRLRRRGSDFPDFVEADQRKGLPALTAPRWRQHCKGQGARPSLRRWIAGAADRRRQARRAAANSPPQERWSPP